MKKLMTLLLVLALCLSLAGSAFAVEEEEAPTPGEQTGTLAVETETPAPEVNKTQVNEAPPEDVIEPKEPQTLADLIAAEGVLSEDGTYVMLGGQYGHLHDDEVRDFAAEASEILKNSESVEGYVTLRPSYGHLCFDISCPYNAAVAEKILESTSATESPEPGVCPYCGKENWTLVGEIGPEMIDMDINYHTEVYYIMYLCNTTGCGGYCRIPKYRLPYEPHTWTQTSVEYTNQGDNHKTTHHYICNVCKATGHETEDEEHELYRTGTVNRHYHRGSRHYIEWNVACSKCGYTGIELEDLPCPGSPSGVGCISIPVHFRVKPADGEEDVAAPEEAPPEDVTVPEEAPTEGTT